jgi:PAS domain S-box-containing protein
MRAGAWDRWLGRWLSKPSLSRWTIGARLTAITLALAVPLNLVILAVIWRLSEAANEAQRASLLYTARSVVAAVDAKLDRYVGLAQALSRLPALLDDNLEVFDAQARAFTTQDAWVAVVDLEGQQLINTLKPPGQRLALRNLIGLAAQKRAFETRSTLVTDVRLGVNSHDWIITIEVPIFKKGQPYRGLSVAVRARSFFGLLNDQHIPKNWFAGIIDGQDRFIVHVPAEGRSTGELVPEGSRNLKDKEGVFELASVEGEPIVVAHARSTLSGWAAGVAVKHAEMRAAVWDASRWATILGGGFSILSLLLAGVMARSIVRPLAELRQKTAALLARPGRSIPPRGPPEVRELWQALRQSAFDRDRSDRAASESEEKLRLALDAAELGIWRWDVGSEEMHWDSRCRAVFGVPPDTRVTWEMWANCIVPEDREQTEANVDRALDPADRHDETVCEFRVRHPDGKVLWLSSTGRAFFEPDPGSSAGRRAVFKAGVIRDVTGIRAAEAELRQSDERLRLSNEAAGIGTFTIDPEAGCVHYSPELAAMLGFPQVRTTKLEDALARVHRDDLGRFRLELEGLLEGTEGGKIRTDFRFVRPGGEVRWMSWAGRAHFREGPLGRIPSRVDGACVDITERKQAEEALRKSEERFRGIFEHAGTGIAISDLEGRYLSNNPAFCNMLGYSREELRGLSVSELVHPEDREANLLLRRRLAAQEIPSYEILNRSIGKDGTPRWLHKHVTLLRDAAGKPLSALALVTDMTDRMRAETALRQSEERFRGIFEHAGTGIAILGMDHKFECCNPTYSAMLGYSEQELREFAFLSHVHPEDRDANAAQCQRLLAEEIPYFEIVNRYVRKDGAPIWVDKHISLLRDGAGRPTNILTLATDVTERKRQDDQIRLLMREVNHRSKNMLSVVQAIARHTLAANPGDFLDRFGKRVEALAANQDLLVKNAWKGADLNELVRSQLATFEELIGSNIKLEGPPLFVSAPAAQALGMALHELVTNAGKYGALSGAGGRVGIAWCIQCNEEGEEIFMMSWSEHCAHPIMPPGKQGFGSFVISKMAEMSLGASVELDYPSTGVTWQLRCAAGEVVQGSVGSVPTVRKESSSAGRNELASLRPRVLVVEDEALVAIEITHALTRAGFEVVGPARNVREALQFLKCSGCDAAVLDINLGRETSEAIAIELTASKTPFVILSGYSPEQHHPVFASAPALRKPLRLQLLIAELSKCIEHRDTGSREWPGDLPIEPLAARVLAGAKQR